ncbi:replication protein [Dehalogenimonas etheniformans]|uniref:replication protein n=1 Tax=Dehalogenimonas etheniformans TaxID=1536648 RepID=UPI000CC124C8|nr:replication protein [Dehalogenimonas etheniformans]QNT75214.1 replication protein [Dehalogenimonas etheniformans]
MASPQLENGFLRIACELIEAISRTRFSPRESQVFWSVVRRTYGWNKKADRISYSQLEESTGLNRRHIADALSRLIRRNIISRCGSGYKLSYGIQKDYQLWIVTDRGNNSKLSLPKGATNRIITETDKGSLLPGATKSLPKREHTIDKKTSSKNNPREDFQKPAKQAFGEFKNVLLTAEERENLTAKLGLAAAEASDLIERLSAYLENHPNKKYASHYATIKTWALDDVKKRTAAGPRQDRFTNLPPGADLKKWENV